MESRRLTQVKEQDAEFVNISSPQSSDHGGSKAKQTSLHLNTEVIDKQEIMEDAEKEQESDQGADSNHVGDLITINYVEPIPETAQQRFPSESQKLAIPGMMPLTSQKDKSRKSLDRHGLPIQPLLGHHDNSFCTEDDTDSKYSVIIKSRQQSEAIKKLNKKVSEISRKSLTNARKAEPENPEKTLSRIQKLKLKGYINEEQYLCLSLLEKGFIPYDPAKQKTSDGVMTPPEINNEAVLSSGVNSQSPSI